MEYIPRLKNNQHPQLRAATAPGLGLIGRRAIGSVHGNLYFSRIVLLIIMILRLRPALTLCLLQVK